MSMSTLESVLIALLMMDAIALATLVLLQHGKGADVGAAFGSGSANTMFGSAGAASFLTRATAWLAIGFFLISFGLAYTAKNRAAELENIGVPQVRSAPQQPAEQAPPEAGPKAGERLTPPPEGVDSHIPDV